jgi:hypothetical protein
MVDDEPVAPGSPTLTAGPLEDVRSTTTYEIPPAATSPAAIITKRRFGLGGMDRHATLQSFLANLGARSRQDRVALRVDY